MLKTRFIAHIIVLLSLNVQAQENALRGVVADASTQQAVEAAVVKLLKGHREQLVGYTLTDSKGAFSIPFTQSNDSLAIAVSLLGYKTHRQAVRPGEHLRITLETEVFNLREVVIRPGRIWSKQDTIGYDVSQFIGHTDESIKDIIGKLPGMDVDATGKISYNGKNVNKFYVEGMDLVDGRYNQITKNLQAKSVETVQVLDNHQPIKMLKDKLRTEDVAINLKLRPKFRDRWMVYLRGGGGQTAGNPAGDVSWLADVNAMQLSRNSQSAYIYKGNNTGDDVTTEQLALIDQGSHVLKEPPRAAFLSQPSFEAPLKTKRLLFNDVHTLSANRLYRLGESAQLRVNAGYTHDYRQQERGSLTSYYQEQDTIRVAEESRTGIRSNRANLNLSIEDNGANRYVTNTFSASGHWDNSTSDFRNDSTFRQQTGTTAAGLKNDLRSLWNHGKYSLEWRSLVRYHHSPSRLKVNETEQSMNLNHFYTDNSFSFLKKKGMLTQRYTAGATAQTSTTRNGYSAYLSPVWQLHGDQWQGTFTAPVHWTQFAHSDFARLMASPALSVEYRYNYAWRFRLYGSYKENHGSITDFYPLAYRTDYRNIEQHSGTLSLQKQQIYSLYGEYKNTVGEFFATLSVTHNRNWSNHIPELVFRDGQIVSAFRNQPARSTGWTLNGTLSKGIYDWRIKASLNYQLNTYRSEQLSNNERLPYTSRSVKLEPKVNWNPLKALDINYNSTIRYGGSRIGRSTRLESLLNVVQQLNLSYNFSLIELGFAADHYYNDVSKDKSINAFLIDASLRWKSGSWQIDLTADNLLNKRQYSYTQYGALQSYTSWINIRGRAFLVSARYRF